MSETNTTPNIIRAENNLFLDGEKIGFIHPTSGKLQMLKGQTAHRPALEAFLGHDSPPEETTSSPNPPISQSPNPSSPIPPCPPMTAAAGDKTPAVIEWYFKYKPEEAAVKYAKRRYSLEAEATVEA